MMASSYSVTLNDFFSNNLATRLGRGWQNEAKIPKSRLLNAVTGWQQNFEKSRAVRVSSTEVDMGMSSGGVKSCGHSGSTEH